MNDSLDMCTLDSRVLDANNECLAIETTSSPVCLFCKEVNENWRNGICLPCYEHCYKERFSDFVFKKIGFCVYCKTYLYHGLQPFQSDRYPAVNTEDSSLASKEKSSTIACLFCPEENKAWCMLNRICESCKTYWHKKRLNEFMLNKIGSCIVCENTVFKGLRRVKHDCTRVGVFVCDYCNRVYGDKLELEKHMERRYGKYTCRRCKVSYCHRMKFDLHCKSHKFETSAKLRIDNSLRLYQCCLCKEGFPTKQALENHEIVHKIDEKKYTCLFCNEIFKSDQRLQLHYRIHRIGKKFKCKYCDEKFLYISLLVLHLESHGDVKKYNCIYCDKRFNRLDVLKIHQTNHENMRNYKCEYCEKGFCQINDLKQHKKKHENLRNYKCKYCEKGFNWSNHLKEHEKIHKNLRIFKCNYCDKGFIRKKSLMKHEKIH